MYKSRPLDTGCLDRNVSTQNAGPKEFPSYHEARGWARDVDDRKNHRTDAAIFICSTALVQARTTGLGGD